MLRTSRFIVREDVEIMAILFSLCVEYIWAYLMLQNPDRCTFFVLFLVLQSTARLSTCVIYCVKCWRRKTNIKSWIDRLLFSWPLLGVVLRTQKLISFLIRNRAIKAPIYFLTRLCDPTSCYGKPVERSNNTTSSWFHWSAPLVSRGNWWDRRTESKIGWGPLLSSDV